jgi:hypothetical protein
MIRECAHCPARWIPAPCCAVTLNHERYCQLSDPSHPDYDPTFAGVIVAKTLGLRRAPKAQPQSEHRQQTTAERRASKPRVALGQNQRRH